MSPVERWGGGGGDQLPVEAQQAGWAGEAKPSPFAPAKGQIHSVGIHSGSLTGHRTSAAVGLLMTTFTECN